MLSLMVSGFDKRREMQHQYIASISGKKMAIIVLDFIRYIEFIDFDIIFIL